jgi:tetratricopeptide (TPR) repeat protein
LLHPDGLLDLLARLVDQSLVLVGHGHRPTRYRLLEPIRAYAAVRLREAGETEAVRERHAHFFAALAERAAPQLWGAEAATWMVGLREERDNLRAAVRWAVQREDIALGVRLARALCWYWHLSGVVGEGRRSVSRILAAASGAGEATARAGALHVAGQLAALDADYAAARGPLEESEALHRRLGDRRGLAHTLNVLGRVRLAEGAVAAARALLEESVALFRAVDDPDWLGVALVGLTWILIEQADYTRARACAEAVLGIYEVTGSRYMAGVALNYLGDVARCEGDYERAEGLYMRSLARSRDGGVEAYVAPVLHNLGYVAVAKGEPARAEALFAESLAMQRDRGDRTGVLECLAGFGAVRAARGQPRRAAVLFGAVTALRATFGAPVWPGERLEQGRHREMVRAALGAGAWDAALAEGKDMTLEDAIAYALEGTDTDECEPPRGAPAPAAAASNARPGPPDHS